jgi:flagellar hook assembly protein FlgD
VWLPHEDFPDEPAEILPEEFSLDQNYPNPFNVSTEIKYELPRDVEVIIEIYNILGQKIRMFDLGHQSAGSKRIVWDGKNQEGISASSGLYLYRIKAADFIQTKRMTLLK